VRRAVLLAVVIVGLTGGLAAAQCNCGAWTETGGPSCYTPYWAGEEVTFKLVVPAEYFFCCPSCETPLITGWRVETMEGTIVYQKQFPDVPKGHYLKMAWDQKDSWYNRVPPGYYRIVVQTTSAGEFESYVQIVQRPCCWGWCGCCCPRLYSCYCCVPYGKPYVMIDRCETYAAAWGAISISIKIRCGCP